VAYEFSPETEKKFQWLLTRYPKKDAVLIPILHKVQSEIGWLSPESMEYVAGRLGLSPARVREVASFYTFFRLDRKGKYVLQVCQTMSCYLRGSDEIVAKLQQLLGIQAGETSADGLFSIEKVECLASCSTAPVMQVNDWDFHEELDLERVEKIVALLKQGRGGHACYEKRVADGGVA